MPSSPAPLQAEQHNIEIAGNSRAWQRKPLVRRVYRLFYEMILARIQKHTPGSIVELGSGQGRIKEVIPECITTDIFPNPWLDRMENAYALSFPDASVGNLILFDVWHHLEYPGTALDEARRVLAPGGRLILFEPSMGWLGLLAYGVFHHEPLRFDHRFVWKIPAGVDAAAAPYFAAQAAATRHFWRLEESSRFEKDWLLVEMTPMACAYYVGSGGFSPWQLIPEFSLPFFLKLDPLLCHFPRLFATRMIIVLERR